MTRNAHIQSKDELLCELELRHTRSQHMIDDLETRRRVLETSLLRLQKLYQNSPIGFITFDQAGKILDINAAATRLLHVTTASVVGLSMPVLIAQKSAARFMEHLRKTRRAAGQPITTELEMIAGKGGHINVQLVTSTVVLDGGRIFETALIDLTAQKAAADAVARAREYAESIVSTIPYPVMVLDGRMRVVSANAAFYHAFQTSEAQVVSWPGTQLPDITWHAPTLDKSFQKALAEGRALENMMVRAEIRRGSLLTLSVNARRLVTDSDASRQLLLVAFEDITRRQRAEEDRELFLTELQDSQARLEGRVRERTDELGKSYEQLRDLGEQLILAHESEQRRIARELHDQVGQDLTALKILLVRGKNGDREQAIQTLTEAQQLTDEILRTVRNICGTLRPQVLDDLGLIAGVRWHIKSFAARTGLDITFDIGEVDESRLSPIVQSAIFRVIQEALTNVSRHADAQTASVILAMRKGAIEFSIRDGGKGFNAAEVLKKHSTGISSMRERLSLVQGRFEVSSSPGQGTIIRAQIPIPFAASAAQKTESGQSTQPNRTNHGKRSKNPNRHRGRSPSRPQGT